MFEMLVASVLWLTATAACAVIARSLACGLAQARCMLSELDRAPFGCAPATPGSPPPSYPA